MCIKIHLGNFLRINVSENAVYLLKVFQNSGLAKEERCPGNSVIIRFLSFGVRGWLSQQ